MVDFLKLFVVLKGAVFFYVFNDIIFLTKGQFSKST